MENKEAFNVNSIVISLIALSQGFLSISDLSLSYLYKDDFSLSPAKVSMLASLTNIPWIIKPLWGFISDCYPILGKRRSPYLVIFGVLGCMCWISMGTFVNSITSCLLTMMLIQISVCFCNVIGEALVVEESQKTKHDQKQASKFVTLFFGVRSLGTVLTAYTGGLLLEIIDKRSVFLITACFPLLLLFSAYFLEEPKFEETPKIKDQLLQIYNFIGRKDIYIPVLFILLFTATPSCGDAMFFYYTNHLNFEPEFMGRMKMTFGIGSIIAMTIYNNFLQEIEFKVIMITTSVICALISMSQLLLVTRLNVVIGIPDELFAVFCTFIVQFTAELNMLPLLVLCCRICPKNIEGCLYALLMSTMNLGAMFSSQTGGLLMLGLGITQTNFKYLWALILITSLIMIAPLPMLALIPDFYKSEDKKGYELV